MKRKNTHWRLFVLLLLVCTLAVALSDPFNTPPIFLAPTESEVQAYTGQPLNIGVEVQDVDGDALNIQVNNLPDWLTFDPYSMQITGQPARIDKGEYIIAIKADDGKVVRSKMIRLDVDYGHTAREHMHQAAFRIWEEKLSKLPGVSIALVSPDGSLSTFAQGYSNYSKKQHITAESRFRIASVSKVMTSALVMRLAEEGYLSLDDPLSKYIPIERIPYGKKITIRQVMSHTAGIIDHLNHGAFYYGNWKYRKWSSNDIINFAARRKARFAPGKGYAYSNTGFYFLGMLIEKVLDQPLDEAYQEWIFEPSGMTDTEYDDYSTRRNRVEGLAENSRAYEYHQSAVGAAGAIISTPSDVARFGYALYNGKLINEASLKDMTTDWGSAMGGDKYGLGTRIWDDHGILHVGHSGLLMGYRSILLYLPQYKVTLALSANHSHYNWYDLVNGVLLEMADYYQ
jgi:CubicO group peptidase (beta-lactamase class C family)